MKKITLTICAATVLLIACNSGETKEAMADSTSTGTTTTETKKDEAWVPVDSATMMKAMTDYATPGPMHQMMASWNGTWTGETTHWQYEGATPSTSPATCVYSMIMGGKYQVNKFKGDMGGMPFEGHGMLAYDNATKKFQSTWIDSWSTGFMNMTGTWDEATKTMNLSGTMPDITRPGKECSLREVYTVVDENMHRMEMYGPDPKTGKEMKVMEIKMTRKK